MPWFMWVLLLIGIAGVVKIKFYPCAKTSRYDDDIESGWILAGVGFVVLFLVAGFGYIAEHNDFIYTYNDIEAWQEKVTVLEKQEALVLEEISFEALRFLNHEKTVYKELKITSKNLAAILTMYPQLRSSEVIAKYIGDIRQLREQITEAEKERYSKIAKYNGAAQAAFRKHFRPKHLPGRIAY